MLSFCHVISAATYVLSYALAAIVSHASENHHEMCMVYEMITFAAILHFGVVIIQLRDKRKSHSDELDQNRAH